jgi:transposase-like protein
MIERKDIISEYEQTGSIRSVARNLGIHRKTVRSYVKEYLAAKAGGDETLTAYLKSEPSYKVPQRDRTALTDEVRTLINVCLRDNEEKR